MRPGQILLLAVVLSAAPVVCFALLALSGACRTGPAALGGAATVIVALGFALLWARDMDLLEESARRALREENGSALERPAIAALDRLAHEIERLGRTLGARSALIARLRQADEAIVERLPEPLVLLGADNAVRRANSAARHVYGADLAMMLRHPVLRVSLDRALAAPGIAQTADVTLPVPVTRDVQATLIALEAPLPDGAQVLAMLLDRSRERAVERTRADFVANSSHELRTPLASLIGFIETLRGPAADDPPAQQRFLGIMAEQAQRMNRLIDDLLSLSRIELTEHQAPSEPVQLADLLARVVAVFEPRVAGRKAALRTSLQPGLPQVPGDGDQLMQVWQNLIDNAMKYGRPGGTVRLSARVAEPGGRWPGRPGVLVSVEDEGQGIAREHLPRLTERFYRVDRGRSRAVGGTGLGLAIVKHIVSRHRGQLAIDSREGAGTTVHVWLPAAMPASPPISIRPEAAIG